MAFTGTRVYCRSMMPERAAQLRNAFEKNSDQSCYHHILELVADDLPDETYACVRCGKLIHVKDPR